jgi:phosphoserine aminotransferase
MKRVYNFSAGPAVIPEEVLTQAQNEMLCYGSSGMSVMEMSHRSSDFEPIIESAEELLRQILGLSDEYKVLFLQGGASMQFAQVPLNLLNKSGKADYIESGSFAKNAIKEASRFGSINVVASSAKDGYTHIPAWDEKDFDPEADYFHITTNNTIFGTRYTKLPSTGDVPLVADMSSNILADEYDFSKFGLIYAGAQKNIGPAGVTVVIVKESLIGNPVKGAPTMLDYKVMADAGSMYNTPPTYGIYIAKLIFEWILKQGGLHAMNELAVKRSNILYDLLDASKLFKGVAEKQDRSLMNVTFVTGDKDLDAKFVKQAGAEGFVNIKGHRSVGGMRASIYNAMPIEGVEALADFMRRFENNA